MSNLPYQLHHGDNLPFLKTLPDNSVDAVVCDPPYGISFMNHKWDIDVPTTDVWKECLRVLKPGGHLLAFASTRTQHRMATRIEDAGFELRDMIAWIYGQGFPKNHDLEAKLRDASASEEEASNWHGWGTALKPAVEPITIARKPLEGTLAENVQAFGVAGLNIGATRVHCEANDKPKFPEGERTTATAVGAIRPTMRTGDPDPNSRWPSNIIHDGSQEVVALFPHSKKSAPLTSTARFFYCAKTTKTDREEGLDGCQNVSAADRVGRVEGSAGTQSPAAGAGRSSASTNSHPTVKPTDLMRYLCRLVTPQGGVVLDPYMGSGSTGKAAMLEGFQFIGAELSAEFHAIAKKRVEHAWTVLKPEEEAKGTKAAKKSVTQMKKQKAKGKVAGVAKRGQAT